MSPVSSNPLFLGLDLSTQQLKAVILDKDSNIVHEAAVNFDRDHAHHGISNGAIHGPDGEVTSPPAMWLEAIDTLFVRLKEAHVNFAAIAAISGAGQVNLNLLQGRNFSPKDATATWLCLLVKRFGRPTGQFKP
jgi:xylulokinase